MIASGQTLFKLQPIKDMVPVKAIHEETGMSYGLSHCGYDIRLKQDIELPWLGMASWASPFSLASAIEEFQMPNNLCGIVHDKSSLARQGLSVFNTVIEPGWKGFLTLELCNKGPKTLKLIAGQPIAQVIFHFTDFPCIPYDGKYQDQADEPVPFIKENTSE